MPAGRPSKYHTHIEPHLLEITEMRKEMTEEQIAKSLGIGYSTWCRYKEEFQELREAIKKGEQNLIEDLKSALIKKAKGFHYKEKKTIHKFENGKETEITEEYEKYAQPDTGAIHLLLKNLDDKWRNDDRETMDIKRRQIEVAEKKAEDNEWS